MAGEETILSRFLTPAIEKGTPLHVVVGIGLLTILVPQVPAIVGSAIVGGYLLIASSKDYATSHNLRKNGVYRDVVSVTDTSRLHNKYYREGYSVFYLLGYELFRKRDFRLRTDSNGNLKDDIFDEIDIEEEVERKLGDSDDKWRQARDSRDATEYKYERLMEAAEAS